MRMPPLKIIGISGSLRAASLNSAVLRAAKLLLPENVELVIYKQLAELPHFNPDLEGSEPSSVMNFRKQLQEADGVLIASPEYAHGVPGTMKNALDWVVASGEFVNKPVALLNVFERSTWAPALLKETLTMMTAIFVESASITLPLKSNKASESDIASDEEVSKALRTSLAIFVEEIKENKEKYADNCVSR